GSVTFEVDGADPLRVTSPPYRRVISIPVVAAVGATIRVTATARDTSGNTAKAEAILTISALPDTENPVVSLNAPAQAAPDTTPPTVTLVAPPRVVAGGTLHLTATATDNVGVATVALLVDGAPIATFAQGPYEADFPIGADTPPGTILHVEARATDFSGLVASDTTEVTIVAAPPPGARVVAGAVYD